MTPDFIKRYFWDIDLVKTDPKNSPDYFIKRILEIGNKKAFFWIKSVFGEDKIKSVISQRKLSPKSQNFWQNV